MMIFQTYSALQAYLVIDSKRRSKKSLHQELGWKQESKKPAVPIENLGIVAATGIVRTMKLSINDKLHLSNHHEATK